MTGNIFIDILVVMLLILYIEASYRHGMHIQQKIQRYRDDCAKDRIKMLEGYYSQALKRADLYKKECDSYKSILDKNSAYDFGSVYKGKDGVYDLINMRIIKVFREDGDVVVSIIKEKDTDKYRFVNLTKCHICKCVFDSYEDAYKDLEKCKDEGRIIGFVC